MAAVISAVLLLLVSWLLTWALLMVINLGLLAIVDHLRARWQRYQRVRQYRRAVAAELMRIGRETVASVERINSGFMLAQRLIRDEAVIHRGHRS
jgi:hypothetical protein